MFALSTIMAKKREITDSTKSMTQQVVKLSCVKPSSTST